MVALTVHRLFETLTENYRRAGTGDRCRGIELENSLGLWMIGDRCDSLVGSFKTAKYLYGHGLVDSVRTAHVVGGLNTGHSFCGFVGVLVVHATATNLKVYKTQSLL